MNDSKNVGTVLAYQTAKSEFNELITKSHDPDLVKPKSKQTDGKVIHVYSDGEITTQKCGDVYLQRTEFILENGFNSIYAMIKGKKVLLTNDLDFPFEVSGKDCKYAIVTRDNAYLIRGKMLEYVKLRKTVLKSEYEESKDVRDGEIKELEGIKGKLKVEINEMVVKLHDPNLIDFGGKSKYRFTNQMIYYVYTDGKIESQERGFSTMKSEQNRIDCLEYMVGDFKLVITDCLEFPLKVYSIPFHQKGTRYATVPTLEVANSIRNKMIELVSIIQQIQSKYSFFDL